MQSINLQLKNECQPERLTKPAQCACIADVVKDTFLELDLVDSIAISGCILLTKSEEKMYMAVYRHLVEQRILELIANHPTINAI